MNEIKESKWYTIDELAELTGFTVNTLKHSKNNLAFIADKMSINLEVNSQMGGYHNSKKFYSENVLKALKEYQLKNSVPNATKDKQTAIMGNVSFVQTETVKQTINNILDNPNTIEMLLQESLKRTQALGLENKQLKDIVEKQKPAVEYHARLIERDHLTGIRDTAKELQIRERYLINSLIENGWIYRGNDRRLRASAEVIQKGYMEEKDWEQNGKSGVQAFFTVKGKEKLLEKMKGETK